MSQYDADTKLTNEQKDVIHAVFDADEVQCPTTFIVVKEKLPDLSQKPEGDEACKDHFENICGWIKKLAGIADDITKITDDDTKDKPEKMVGALNKRLKNLIIDETKTMYFYLVDDLTRKPVTKTGSPYPIEITKPSEIVLTLFPYLRYGLMTMSLYNGTAGILQMFGIPAPKVYLKEAEGKLKESLKILGQKSSARIRRPKLRDLRNFLRLNDQNDDFAGLSRVPGYDGTALWTAVPENDRKRYLDEHYQRLLNPLKTNEENIIHANGTTTGGATDSPWNKPDRLKYDIYAKSLGEVVRSLESNDESVCTALFAPWGTGKTFLYHQIKTYLIESSEINKGNKENDKVEQKKKVFWDNVTFSLDCVCGVTERLIHCCCCCGCSFKENDQETFETVAAVMIITFPFGLVIFIFSFLLGPFLKLLKKCSKSKSGNDSDDADVELGEMNANKSSWSNIKKIYSGETNVFLGKNINNVNHFYFRLIILSAVRQVYVTVTTMFEKPYKYDGSMTKYIFIEFNAWIYSGSDLLWASMLEKLWTAVENECGKYSVRLHRAGISLSGEEISQQQHLDETKEERESRIVNRAIAIRKKILTGVCYVIGGLIISILTVIVSQKRVWRLIVSITSFYPSLFIFVEAGRAVGREIFSSRGMKILKDVQTFEKHQRVDFSERTGFMGEVKREVEYLFDFVRTHCVNDSKFKKKRPIRLSLFIDDLDRLATSKEVVKVLEALILLLVDSPITCWLAVDSRLVVTSIDDCFGAKFSKEGLDGYKFLEKIVQLPFCIPDLEKTNKMSFVQKTLDGKGLTPLQVYDRVRFLQRRKNIGKDLLEKNSTLHFENEALEALIPVFKEMRFRGWLQKYSENTGGDDPSTILKALLVEPKPEWSQKDGAHDQFLHMISVVIEQVLIDDKKNQDDKEEVRDDGENKAATKQNDVDSNDTSSDTPSRPPSEAQTVQDDTDPYELWSQPLANLTERKWFNKYCNYLVGKPRKIKRIINSYMVARLIANKKKSEMEPTDNFFKKLLKFTILLEQWPCRMAWMMLVVENLHQQIEIRVLEENSEDLTSSIGKCLISLFESKVSGKITREYCNNISLVEIYRRVVYVLIHASNDATEELHRDGDPQDFEMILLEDNSDLKLKDIALPGQSGCEGTLRPYSFNLQRHMVENAAIEFEKLMLVSTQDGKVMSTNSGENDWFASYKKKSKFFEIEKGEV